MEIESNLVLVDYEVKKKKKPVLEENWSFFFMEEWKVSDAS